MPISIFPSASLFKKWWCAGKIRPGTPRFYSTVAMGLVLLLTAGFLASLVWDQVRQIGRFTSVKTALGTKQAVNTSEKAELPEGDPAYAIFQGLRLLDVLSRMEKAERLFALKGDSVSLEAYNQARKDFALLQGFEAVIHQNHPEQGSLLAGVREKVEHWQREIAYPEMSAKQAGKAVSAQQSPLLGQARADLERALRLQQEALQKVYLWQSLLRCGQAAGALVVALLLVNLLLRAGCEAVQPAPAQAEKAPAIPAQPTTSEEPNLGELAEINPLPTMVFSDSGRIHAMNEPALKLFSCKGFEGIQFYDLVPQRLLLHDIARLERGTLRIDAVRSGNQHFSAELCFGKAGSNYLGVLRELADDKSQRAADELLRMIAEGLTTQTGQEFRRSFIKYVSKALHTDYAFITQACDQDTGTCTLLVCDDGEIRRLPNYPVANTACRKVIQNGFQSFSGDLCAQFPEDELLREFKPQTFVALPFYNTQGRVMGFLGVMNRKAGEIAGAESTLKIFSTRAAGILQRKSYEEELAAEKERLAIILRSMGDGFITTDVDGRVLLMNKAAELLTGHSQAQAAGRHLREIFVLLDEVTRKPDTRAVERIVETGAVIGSAAAILVGRDATERMVESSASLVRDGENKKIGVALVFRDVTERSRIEEERSKAEKLESLGVAAGGIAHDFNNLLTAIIGNISLSMLTLPEDESTAEHLAGAKKASLRAQELAQQLLTFAKGGAPIKRTASIKQLVSDTVTFSLRGSNVGSAFEFPENLWAAEIDSGQISQVIGNLVINAKQAMPQGGTVRVACANLLLEKAAAGQLMLEPGRYVTISVEDKGTGIPEENLKKIFDPYFTTKPKGSGLGLATAYSIIKNHDGLITVESRVGEGSKFSVYLPASEHTAPERQTHISLPIPSGGGRILVLDDEEAICALVSHTLTPLGYEVVETNDPITAIKAYEKALNENRRFDAVITDLTIPNCMGGQEAVKELLAIDPSVKAIVSSGYANDPVMSRYKEYGFCACIAKPYEITDLAILVDEVVHGKSSKDSQ